MDTIKYKGKMYVKSDAYKEFKDLPFQPLEEKFYGPNAKSARMMFPNGYGVSVVSHKHSYGGGEGLYELAVLDKNGELVYNTPVTNDVLGYLEPTEVTDYMKQVQALPPAK